VSGYNPARERALAGYDAGLCPIPPKQDGSKRPEPEYVSKAKLAELFGAEEAERMCGGQPAKWTWKHRQVERPTRAEVERQYANGRTGVGFACGKVSGNLELFEFEDRDIHRAFKERAEALGLGELVRRVEEGYSSATPGGGVHWLYFCPVVEGNTELACRPKRTEEMKRADDKIAVLIETRGEGGYTVEAPSNGRVHPSGHRYEQLAGAIDTIVTITPDERRELHQLARTFDQVERIFLGNLEGPSQSKTAGNRPGDDFNARATWPEILEPHGWTPVQTIAGETYWKRPGTVHAWSATTNYADSDLFYCFTSSTEFEQRKSHSKFAVYAVLSL
jgi:putative DNA primase/helicase